MRRHGRRVIALHALRSALIPVGKVSSAGTEVTIRATDEAGNVSTLARQLRVDVTPPSVLMESSPVYDEAQSTADYSLDDAATNTWLQRHVVGGAPKPRFVIYNQPN